MMVYIMGNGIMLKAIIFFSCPSRFYLSITSVHEHSTRTLWTAENSTGQPKFNPKETFYGKHMFHFWNYG